MSPTEDDLRAALSDGEGDGPDPDRLIALGHAHRARRRMQMLSAAAAVIVVGGGGVGIVALARGGGGDDKASADSAAGRRYESLSGAAGNAAGGATAAAVPSAAAASSNAEKSAAGSVRCPSTLPRYALPGGGSPGQFGADGPLFSKPVQTVVVCGYAGPMSTTDSAASASGPARVALTGTRASKLAASLNDAAAKPSPSCPAIAKPVRELAIIGVAADGTAAGTITVTHTAGNCAAQVTNGTAVRYNWTPPSELLPIIATLTPTPKMHGSPISS